MSRPTLHDAITWIAVHDTANNDTMDNPDALRNVEHYLTVALIADLFDVSRATIAKHVMAERKNTPRVKEQG